MSKNPFCWFGAVAKGVVQRPNLENDFEWSEKEEKDLVRCLEKPGCGC